MTSRRSLHDNDFYAWSLEQAALLRAGRVGEADLAAIAEEIESMGKTRNANWSAALRSSCSTFEMGAPTGAVQSLRGGSQSQTRATKSQTSWTTIQA